MLDAVLALNGLDTRVFDSIPKFAPSSDNSAEFITVPDAHLLFTGEFKRVGSNDLKIVGEDGKSFLIEDYFASEQRAHLMSPEGATLAPHVVAALAGPLAPGQSAQAGAQPASSQPVIGRVDSLSGSATVVRNGVTVALNVGDTVRKGDVVQTSGGSAVAIVLADGSTFSLTSNARMVLDDFVYSAGASNNSSLVSLVQGTFSFVAGQVAKTGDMRVETPVATMGIRGTAVLVEISANDGRTRFSVMVEPDGTTGSLNLFNKTTGALIATINNSAIGWVVTPAGLVQQVQKTPGELQQELGIVQQIFTIFNNNQQNPFVPPQQPDQTDPNRRGQNPNDPNPQTAQGPGGSGTPPGGGAPGEPGTPTPPVITVNITQTGTVTLTGPGGTPIVLPVDLPPPPIPFTLPPLNIMDFSGAATGQTIIGGEGADQILGSNFNDIITANGGDDLVFAGYGDDIIIAGHGGGNDFYDGGDTPPGATIPHRDTIRYESANGVTFNLNSGTFPLPGGVVVKSSTAVSATTGFDLFVNIERIIASPGDDVFILHDDGDWEIDAGAGVDIARIAGGFNIIGEAGPDISNVEIIDLNQTFANIVDFEPAGVWEANEEAVLRILGGSTDVINIKDTYVEDGQLITGEWRLRPVNGTFVDPSANNVAGDPFNDHHTDGVTFQVYEFVSGEQVKATVYLQQGIQVNPGEPDVDAVDDTASMTENQVLFVNVVANDAADVPTSKTLTALGVASIVGPSGVILGNPAIVIENNQLRITPGTAFDALAVGETATITVPYTMQFGTGETLTATATVTVTGTNDSPHFSLLPEGLDSIGTLEEASFGGVDALRLTSAGASRGEVEQFLGLNAGTLSGIDPETTDGAAVAFELTLAQGETISFSWNFASAEYEPFNDYGFFSVSSAFVQKLSDIFTIGDDANDGFVHSSGWQQFTYTADAAAEYLFGIGVMNTRDTLFDSFLYISGFTGLGFRRTTTEDGEAETFNLLNGAFDPDTHDVLSAFNYVMSGIDQDGNAVDVTGAVFIDGSNATIVPHFFDYLSDGEQVTVVVNYQVSDGHAPVSNSVTLVVTGANDAPEIDNGPIKHTFHAGDPGFTQHLTATDPDQGDTQTWTVVGGTTPDAASYSFKLDEFKVTRPGGVIIFDDTFDNGLPPPNSSGATGNPGSMLTYSPSPIGSFTESGGFVILDSDHTGTISGAGTGNPFAANIETLLTNTDPAGTNDDRGLKISNDFTVTGTFSLDFPDDLRETYGLRLSDNQSSLDLGHDTLELSVRKGQNGLVQVQFRSFDPAANTTPVGLASFFLDPSLANAGNKIALHLSHVTESQEITASFDILDNTGNVLQTVNFTPTGQIFGDHNWTRAQFVAYAPETSDSYLTGTYGALSVDALGNWSYALQNNSDAVRELAAGDIRHDIFSIKVADASGAFDTKPVDITIIGINDAPEVFWTPGAITIPGNTPLYIAGMQFEDVDAAEGEVFTIAVTVTHGSVDFGAAFEAAENLGLLPIDLEGGDGTIAFSGTMAAINAVLSAASAENPAFMFEAMPGYTGPASFQFSVTDELGASDSATLAIQVQAGGLNSPPTVNFGAPSATLVEDSVFQSTVQVTLADPDGDDVSFDMSGWTPTALAHTQAYNGHFYLYVSSGEGISWNGAQDVAAGMGGHLATITTAGENQFVFGLIDDHVTDGSTVAYLGGARNPGDSIWRWYNGNEDGQIFDNDGVLSGYTNWREGEPNNDGGDESILVMEGDGTWNDAPGFYGAAVGFVVEFSDLSDYTLWQTGFGLDYGNVVLNIETGQLTYNLDNSSQAVQTLTASDHPTEIVQIRAVDEHGASNTTQIAFQIDGADDGTINVVPTLDSFTLAVAEGGTVVLSSNDFSITDPDSTSHYFALADVTGGEFQVWNGFNWVSSPTGGFTTAQIDAGQVRFAHNGGEDAPSFTIWANDFTDAGPPISPTVNFTPVNDAPVLHEEASPVLGSVSQNSGPPSGAVGTLISALVDFAAIPGGLNNVTDVDSSLTGIAIYIASPPNGTLHYTTNGGETWSPIGEVSDDNALLLAADDDTRLYFQPNPDFSETVNNLITFRAWDQTEGTNGQTFNIGIGGANTTSVSSAWDGVSITVDEENNLPPVANDDTVNTTEDHATINIHVAQNDSDDHEVSLIATDGSGGTNFVLSNPSLGALQYLGFGEFTFTPAANVSGSATFNYQAFDGVNYSNTATVTINVAPVEDAPETISPPEPYTGDAGETIVIPLSGFDAETGVTSFRIVNLPGGGTLYRDAVLTNEITLETGNNLVNAVSNSATVYFVPDAEFTGETSFDFAARDTVFNEDPTPGTILIEVTAANDPPVAVGETLTGDRGGFTYNSANGHWYTINHQELTWTQARAEAIAAGGYLATVTSSGENDFVSALLSNHVAFHGLENAYAYIGASDHAAENEWRWIDGPEAGQQFWQGGTGGFSTNGAYENWERQLANPAVLVEPNGLTAENVAYIRGTGGWVDFRGSSEPELLSVIEISFDEDRTSTIPTLFLLGNDTDAEGANLSVHAVSATSAQGGTVSLAGGMITYVPAANFSGTDSFTYTVTDGNGVSNEATVTFDVAPVNNAGSEIYWTGAASGDWENPANWDPAQMPDVDDDVIFEIESSGIFINGEPIEVSSLTIQSSSANTPAALVTEGSLEFGDIAGHVSISAEDGGNANFITRGAGYSQGDPAHIAFGTIGGFTLFSSGDGARAGIMAWDGIEIAGITADFEISVTDAYALFTSQAESSIGIGAIGGDLSVSVHGSYDEDGDTVQAYGGIFATGGLQIGSIAGALTIAGTPGDDGYLGFGFIIANTGNIEIESVGSVLLSGNAHLRSDYGDVNIGAVEGDFIVGVGTVSADSGILSIGAVGGEFINGGNISAGALLIAASAGTTLDNQGFITIYGVEGGGGQIDVAVSNVNRITIGDAHVVFSEEVDNTNRIQIHQGGYAEFASDVANAGVIELSGESNVDFFGNLSGFGSVVLQDSAAYFDGVVSDTVTVQLLDTGNTLSLDRLNAFDATVQLFGAGDIIELLDFAFDTTSIAAFADGTLTIAASGETYELAFAGDYNFVNFHLREDENGVTEFVYTEPVTLGETQLVATPPAEDDVLFSPAFGNDGRLAYWSFQSGEDAAIGVFDPIANTWQEFSVGSGFEVFVSPLSFSYGGEYLAFTTIDPEFTSDTINFFSQIVFARTDGGGYEIGSTDSEGNALQGSQLATFAPDSPEFAFWTVVNNGSGPEWHFAFKDYVDGDLDITTLASPSGSNDALSVPMYSADGSRLVVAAAEMHNGPRNLYLFTENGSLGGHGWSAPQLLLAWDADSDLVAIEGTSPVVSNNGRFVAFASAMNGLVAEDIDSDWDYFLLDTRTQEVSYIATGAQTYGADIVFSPDETKVAFHSTSDLVAEDTNGVSDVYIKDLATGGLTLVSSNAYGLAGSDASYSPAFSPDGMRLAFDSLATDLADSTNGSESIFLRPIMPASVTVLASDGFDFRELYNHMAAGTPIEGVSDSFAVVGPTYSFQVWGHGFAYDSLSGPVNVYSGVIDQIDIMNAAQTVVLAQVENVHISAPALIDAVQDYATSFDEFALDAIFMRLAYQAQGGSGHDILIGGDFDDTLTGGLGDDTFVFGNHGPEGIGQDTITDFIQGQDKIALYGLYDDFDELEGHISIVSGSTRIDFGGGHTITLQNSTPTLTHTDFIFHA